MKFPKRRVALSEAQNCRMGRKVNSPHRQTPSSCSTLPVDKEAPLLGKGLTANLAILPAPHPLPSSLTHQLTGKLLESLR